MKSTEDFSAQIDLLSKYLSQTGAVVIGAGAGMSTSAGLTYSGKRFRDHFPDYIEKYGFQDMYSAGFYPYPTLEEYWAYWSRYIMINRYDQTPGKPYRILLNLLKDKDYFVLTTNVDHQFQLSGFDKKRLFYTQGDYGLWQCSKPCHRKTYDNETAVRSMAARQSNMRIPTELIPLCPLCGAPMSMNLRMDGTFVEDEGWHAAAKRYQDFIRRHLHTNILYLELGVGGNTPGIIKYPFWQMTYQNDRAVYGCVNLEEAVCPREIEGRAVCIQGDILGVLEKL